MVAQELAPADIMNDNLIMENRDSFHPASIPGESGYLASQKDGIRVNRALSTAAGTREGFQEQIGFDAKFNAIVAASLFELSMQNPADDEEEPEEVLKRSRGYDFAK